MGPRGRAHEETLSLPISHRLSAGEIERDVVDRLTEAERRIVPAVPTLMRLANYEAAAEAIPGAIGLSGSTVSRGFIEASAAKLRELQERDLKRFS